MRLIDSFSLARPTVLGKVTGNPPTCDKVQRFTSFLLIMLSCTACIAAMRFFRDSRVSSKKSGGKAESRLSARCKPRMRKACLLATQTCAFRVNSYQCMSVGIALVTLHEEAILQATPALSIEVVNDGGILVAGAWCAT